MMVGAGGYDNEMWPTKKKQNKQTKNKTKQKNKQKPNKQNKTKQNKTKQNTPKNMNSKSSNHTYLLYNRTNLHIFSLHNQPLQKFGHLCATLQSNDIDEF